MKCPLRRVAHLWKVITSSLIDELEGGVLDMVHDSSECKGIHGNKKPPGVVTLMESLEILTNATLCQIQMFTLQKGWEGWELKSTAKLKIMQS